MSGFEPTEAQSGVGSNFLTLIDPDAIPYPETDTWSLNYAAETLRTGGGELGSITEAMESTWQGLQEHYEAPESETLFAAVGPVATIGAGLEGDLATVATALEELAEAAAVARRELNSLRIQAQGFVRGLEDREFWWLTKDEENDEWSLETNFALKSDVNSAWSDFTAAEIACANTINGVYGGATFASPDDATGADNELVYGESRLMFEPGEDARSAAHAVTAWSLDNITEWAGQHFNPESVQFDNPRGQAAWDTLALGVVWGPVQGAVTKTGYWSEKSGWAGNNDEYVDNLKRAWTDTALEAGELFGVRNEDGWLYDPRSDNPTENLSWGWWWDNAKNSGEEIREGHAAWSKRESDPEYQQTYTAINTITLLGGPIKLGLDVLNLGNGRSGGSTGIESGSESGPFGGQGTGPGTGGSDLEIGDVVADGRVPITERFDDIFKDMDFGFAGQGGGPTGSPSPVPPSPPSSPNSPVPLPGATNPNTWPPSTPDTFTPTPNASAPNPDVGRGPGQTGEIGTTRDRGSDPQASRGQDPDRRPRGESTNPPIASGGNEVAGDRSGTGTGDRVEGGRGQEPTRPRAEDEPPEHRPGRRDDEQETGQGQGGSGLRAEQGEVPAPRSETEAGGGNRNGGGKPPPIVPGNGSGPDGPDDAGGGDGEAGPQQPSEPDRSEVLPENAVHDYGVFSRLGGSGDTGSGMDPQRSSDMRELIRTHPETRGLQFNDKKLKLISDNLESHPRGAEIAGYLLDGDVLRMNRASSIVSNLKDRNMIESAAQEFRVAVDVSATGVSPDRVAFPGKNKSTGEDLDIAVLDGSGNVLRGYQAYIPEPGSGNPVRSVMRKLRRQLPSNGEAENSVGVVQFTGNLDDFPTKDLAALRKFSADSDIFLHLHFDDYVVVFPSGTVPYREGD